MTDGPDPRLSPCPPARPGSRGYWIGPAQAGGQPAAPEAGVVQSDRQAERESEAPHVYSTDGSSSDPRSRRARAKRKRRLWRLAALLVVLIGIATAITLIVTGRTVVPVVSENLFPIRFQADIARVAQQYGLDPYLIAAVAKTESGFDPAAVSPAGAVGLMQLMPATAEWIVGMAIWRGDDAPDLTDPADSLELGACYLAYLSERFGEDNRLAVLAAYNGGPNAVDGWIEDAGGMDSFGLEDVVFLETRNFVQRVERYRILFTKIHPEAFEAAGGSAAGGSAAGGSTTGAGTAAARGYAAAAAGA